MLLSGAYTVSVTNLAEGEERMKNRIWVFGILAAWILLLTGCGEIVREPASIWSDGVDLDGCSTVSGTVLDASSKSLFLRADDGREYVFSLLGATIKVQGHLQADQHVKVFYSFSAGETELKESNSKHAQVEYICEEGSE